MDENERKAAALQAEIEVAAVKLGQLFLSPPSSSAGRQMHPRFGAGWCAYWTRGDSTDSLQFHLNHNVTLGAGKEDAVTQLLAASSAPQGVLKVQVTCDARHEAASWLRLAIATKSELLLRPIMVAAVQVAELSVAVEARKTMFPPADVQEILYLGGDADTEDGLILLAFAIVVPLENAILALLKNRAAEFLQAYLHIATTRRVGEVSQEVHSVLQQFQLKKS